MTDYREINAIAKNPARARQIALFLLKIEDIEWTAWEYDFLDHMALNEESLTTRQAEKVVELREEADRHEKVEGFVLRTLVEKCFIYGSELDEGDEEFIRRMKGSGAIKFRRREARRILRCARAIDELAPHQGWTLDKVTEAIA